MFPEAPGKEMGSIIFGDKVEIRHWGWIEGSHQRREARIADGSGRKTLNTVSVVRTAALKISARQISGEVLETIDHGRITLKGHFVFQPIMKDRRDQRALGFNAGFLFNQ